ncbi:MAG: two-component regulator propeller domain-containing protein [Bacteroidota bacterium]
MTRCFRILIICLLSIPLCYSSGSVSCWAQADQQITFTNWQKDDGLPSNNVLAVTKDHRGFLWIATTDGLCRYDGPGEFKVFRSDEEQPDQPIGLKSSNIRTLICDRSGNLWIGTRYGGITRYNPETNASTTFIPIPGDSTSLSHDEVLTILEDSRGCVWVGTENGLNLFDSATSTFTRFYFTELEGGNSAGKAILKVYEDHNGWIWAGTWAGGLHLLLEDASGKIVSNQVRHFRTGVNRATNNIWSLFQDSGGRFWVGSHGGGLLLMNLPNEASNQVGHQDWVPVFHSYVMDSEVAPHLSSNYIQSIIEDQFGTLWLGTAYGLHAISKNFLPSLNPHITPTITFNHYMPTRNLNNTLVGENVMTLYEDEQGLIWASTSQGLSQYNWYSNQFELYDLGDEEGADIQDAKNLIQDKNKNIWIGKGYEGILKFKIIRGQFIPQKDEINDLIPGEDVNTIYSPDQEWLYAGTELGISAVNLETRETLEYPVPPEIRATIHNMIIEDILIDRKGFIWFGTGVGLFRIDPKDKSYTHYEPKAGEPQTISDLSVNYLVQDRTGAIWVSTFNGLNRINDPWADTVVFEQLLYDAQHPESGPIANQILLLKETREYMYIGTPSGICRYSFATKKFEGLNGVQHKYYIHGMEEDQEENLWISTNEGILCLNPHQKTYRVFDKKDGLRNTKFRRGSSFIGSDGKIFFAYRNGLCGITPGDFFTNTTVPPVYITEIEKINPQGSQIETRFDEGVINLAHDDYRLQVKFAALNYIRADKNRYKYRLVGFEEKWNDIKFGVPIMFTNLEPNTYRLEIRASNNDDIWNNEGYAIEIIQHPPFWQTWWFRALLFLFVVGIPMYAFVWYTNNIRKRNEMLRGYNESLNEEISRRAETEFQLQQNNKELTRSNKDLEQFAYIASHDLKEPIRVIGSYSSMMSKRYAEALDPNGIKFLGFIEAAAERMSNLISSLLTFSAAGNKNQVIDSVNLEVLVAGKLEDLSELIQEKNALVEVAELPIIQGHRERIGMVFYNLIHNAIKFNEHQQPHVVIEVESVGNSFWKFSISDNGIGIEQEFQENIFDVFKRIHAKDTYEGTGIGLSVCRKIIRNHQGDIWLESKLGSGTTFYFTIKKELDESGNPAVEHASRTSIPYL